MILEQANRVDIQIIPTIETSGINSLNRRVQNTIEEVAQDLSYVLINGLKVRTPYWMNYDSFYAETPLYMGVRGGGKYNKDQIVERCNYEANLSGFQSDDPEMMHLFMLSRGIGVDCSGFAYQTLRAVYYSLGGEDNLRSILVDATGNHGGITRTGARHLTSNDNSRVVNSLHNIRPADLIRCGRGGHVMVVAGVNPDGSIKVIHTTNATFITGIHSFTIRTNKPDGTIFEQNWEENLVNGYNLGRWMNENRDGDDGIYRLKVLDDLYNQQVANIN